MSSRTMTATEPEEDFAAPASPLQAGSRLLPRLGVLAAAVLWGTTGTAQYYGPAGTDPVAVGYLRLTTGAVTLLLAVLARPGALAAFRDCFRSGRLRWTAIASVAVAGYQIAFFEGVHHTGVAMGTLLALGSAPVFTGLFAFWLMRERFEPGWRVATLLAVAGCTCILLPGRFSGSEVDTLGVLLTLTAGFCYGLYTVTLKRLIADDAPLLAGLTATLAVGSVVLSLFAVPYLATHPGSASPLVGAAGFVLVAWLGIVTTAVAYLLFISGLHRVPAASVGTLALAEPLVAALLGLSLIGERPGAMTAVGGVLLLGGLVILTVRTPARTAQPTD